MMQTGEYNGPLTGLNVIDFGHYYAGPMAGMLLADQGANVIRVVKPGEPELRKQQYRLINRNKKLLTLDLKTNEGKAQALLLIEQADIMIENFRPGVMKRLGLDYPSVKTTNPGLIYLSLPGFASTDKERAHIQAWEGVLNAAAGFYNQSSRVREMLHFPPVYTWVPLCSAHGSMHGTTAIMAALIARAQHGSGTVIEVPLFEAGSAAVSSLLLHIDPAAGASAATRKEPPAMFKPFVFSPHDSPDQQLEKLQQAAHAMMPSPFYVLPHTCADGRKLVVCCGGHPTHIAIFLKALGLDQQLKREGFVNEGPWQTGLDNNLSGTLSVERTQRLKQLVTEKLLTKPALEWEALLGDAGFPASLVRTRDEWFALSPMWETGVFTTMDNDESTLQVPGQVASVSRPHGDEPFSEACLEPERIDWQSAVKFFATADAIKPDSRPGEKDQNPDLRSHLKKGDLLKGLKILDLSSVLAGPTCSYTLAQYGADVIRLEPPGDSPGLLGHKLEIMQGKRSMLVDVKTAPGREVFEKLIGWADVVVHNCLDDVTKRLGIAHDQLQAINPTTVTCQISAFGGTRRGGWENRPGYDCLAQSVSGLMVSFGSMDMPEDHGAITCGDVTTGEAAAFAALLGIYQRERTGYAGEARTSLVQGINFTQLPYMISENGNSNWGEAHGQFAVGPSEYQRLYACRDGWIYVGTTEERAGTLAEVVTGRQEMDVPTVETHFAKHDCHYWLDKLLSQGIACHRAVMPVDTTHHRIRQVNNETADETLEGSLDILHRADHPGGLKITFAGPTWVRIGENHSYKRLSVAPKLGEHTTEVLAELGYSADEIEEMLRLKVAYEFVPAIGSKDALLFNFGMENKSGK